MIGRIPEAQPTQPRGQEAFQFATPSADGNLRLASDVKEAHLLLRNYNDDELRRIPILPEGARLEEGAIYLDLRDPARCPFKATGGMTAGPHHYYVPKARVEYPMWNRLIGVLEPVRIN